MSNVQKMWVTVTLNVKEAYEWGEPLIDFVVEAEDFKSAAVSELIRLGFDDCVAKKLIRKNSSFKQVRSNICAAA